MTPPSHAAKGSNVAVGAQNLHWEKEGAYTGEISASMLAAVGVTHVIIGHSERRQYFGETDDTVNLKLKSALEAGLTPSSASAKSSKNAKPDSPTTSSAASASRAFHKVSAKKAAHLVVAYEPVWAIGTGKTATPANRRRRPRHHPRRSRASPLVRSSPTSSASSTEAPSSPITPTP